MARLTVTRGVMALAILGGGVFADTAVAQEEVQEGAPTGAQEGAQDGAASGPPMLPIAPPAPYDSTGGESATGSLPPEPSPRDLPPSASRAPEEPTPESTQSHGNGTSAETRTDNGEGRFTFSRMNDGYVRLDNRTGQVSFCSKRTVGWTCQLAPEDRGVLENEITRLQEENVRLKKELLTHALPLPGSMKGEPPVARNERSSSLPSDPSIERMKAVVERAWRQLVDMITSLQRDVLKKS